MQADRIGDRKQLVDLEGARRVARPCTCRLCAHPGFLLRELGRRVGPRWQERIGVDDAHAEAERAARQRAADPAVADDAERLAREPQADQLVERPSGPRAGADQALALAEPARAGQEQRERQLRGGLGQDIGRVGDAHARGSRSREVDVVDADRAAGDHLQPGRPREQRGIDPVEQQADQRVGVGEIEPGDRDVAGGGDLHDGTGQGGGDLRGEVDR